MNPESSSAPHLLLTADQVELRNTVRRFLRAHAPMSRVRESADSDEIFDTQLWNRMATELGLVALAIPERFGGAGGGHVERGVVLTELGRALAPCPYLGCAVLAADALLALDDHPARDALLGDISDGSVVVALAAAEGDSGWPVTSARTRARFDGTTWRLDGHKSLVVDGASADTLLVYAATDEGPAFFLVEAAAPGLRRTRLVSLDTTRALVSLEFVATPARIRLPCADAAAALSHVADLAKTALAAEQLGGLARVTEIAVDHARTRIQFGRVIGSFQAVKHGCVDSYVDYELCTSMVRYASWVADHAPDQLPVAASAAYAAVSSAYFAAAARTIQLLGGIGYTWEHEAHLYYRRAKSTELLFGPPHRHHAALADRLGI